MSADQLLTHLFNAGVAVSIISTVLALGMSYSVAELLAPLRRVWVVVSMIVVNSVLVPQQRGASPRPCQLTHPQ